MSNTLTAIAQAALEDYRNGKVHIEPLYPAVLVRVLPKPDKYGMLILAEAYRNKPIYEGVVLRTWRPKTIPFSNHATSDAVKQELMDLVNTIDSSVEMSKEGAWTMSQAAIATLRQRIDEGFSHPSTLVLTPEVEVGDHVIFPHWGGEPVQGLSADEYRLMPERSLLSQRALRDVPEILGKIVYAREDTAARLLSMLSQNTQSVVTSICDAYDLIPKDLTSKLEYVEPTKRD